MEKEFKYKDVKILVKTNFIKGGTAYYGEHDIQNLLEFIYKECLYGKPTTDELTAITVFNEFKKKAVKLTEIKCGRIVHRGEKITDLNIQKQLD